MTLRKKQIQNVIISRPDSIGDAVLAISMGKILKDYFPGVKVAYLGKEYTRDLIAACEYIDEFIEINDFLQNKVTVCGQAPEVIIHAFTKAAVAKRAKALRIPLRIGTTNRLYHWYTCNKLIRLSRKKSDLNEAQLNLKLLAGLGIHKTFTYDEIIAGYGLSRVQPLRPEFMSLINKSKYNIIFHTKSQGNAIEWGMENFAALAKLLNPARYTIFVSGTEKERPLIAPLFAEAGHRVVDIIGKMDLAQFISFIRECNGLVACSTGPAHLSAALDSDTYGLYSVHRPILPERWGPIGKHVFLFLSQNKKYSKDMSDISPESVQQVMDANMRTYLKID